MVEDGAPQITFDDFLKVDVRVGTIVDVQEFPEARKPAYKLTIDFGAALGRKKSSAQITKHYSRDSLLGRQVAAVVNFPPRQIDPFMSEVLTLGFPNQDGEVVLIGPDLAVPDGGRLLAMHRPLRLTVDRAAIQANWRWLADRAGVAAGAAVKADGYGLGARETTEALLEAGCRDFFVSTWAEAEALGNLPGDVSLVVLHGVGPDDVEAALSLHARPVLNTAEQVARWKEVAPGRPCDVMIDTGINRLGLRPEEVGALDGLAIGTLHSHLALADEDHAFNQMQLERFRAVAAAIPAKRYSFANSAGICLGRDYSFDLVRPGLSLYGGIPRPEAEGDIRQVARVEAQIVQRRTIRSGETCGYGATFTAPADTEAAVLNIGYADGYLRGFSSRGSAFVGEFALPVLGRVSMDLLIVGCDAAPELGEGDWVELDYDLPSASKQSGLSQYELLTTLGSRFERVWK